MKKRLKVLVVLLLVGIVVVGVLFVVNGTLLAGGEQPSQGTVTTSIDEVPVEAVGQVRVMAFNLAKCFVMTGAVSFESEAAVLDRLDKLAAIIRAENPDIVCLSEVMTEAGPCDVNQVAELARKTGLRHWAFGENYCFGLPFLRVVGGNAILSRYPIEPVANLSLAGRRPFYITRNSRRALFARVVLPSGSVGVWSLHNDSYDMDNNLVQVEQLLKYPGTVGSIMAGDFNAGPESGSIKRLWQTNYFAGQLDGESTFPVENPDQRIDFVFGPRGWTLLEHKVIHNDVSDHCAVMSVFVVGGEEGSMAESQNHADDASGR
jgi:endonuclease/exonuclease/phosphatase family metal-dependent hydrolase